LYGDNLPIGERKIPIRFLKNDYNIKFHLYSLKVSTNVKIAMQCFENVGAGKCPKCPPWLRAWVDAYACCAIVRWFCSNNFLWLDV